MLVKVNNMPKRLLLLFLTCVCLAIAGVPANAQTGSQTASQTLQKPDTVFFEDFNATTLDRQRWNVEVTGNTVNNEQQAYVDSSSTLYLVQGTRAQGAVNGALVINPLYRPGYRSQEGHKYNFISGRINTRSKFEFRYGTASCRMKIASGSGLWPAFWALGEGKWPDCGEIDVMETVGDSAWVSHALHGPGYFGNTPFAYHAYFPKGTDVTGWHVYSVDWLPGKLVFKVDGTTTYTVTRAMTEKYGRWAFDHKKFIILNFALGGGYPNAVNKISKPYFGLGEASLNKVKAGEAKIIVDWVLVKKPAR